MFKLSSEDSNARLGKLKTKSSTVNTPFFMPIATKGSVKQLSPDDLNSINTEAIIANAFILSLKPGLGVINSFKGIHKFMNWNKTIFTDSGGFQILSKSFLHKHSSHSVHFKNPYTGQIQSYTPEDVMDIEKAINSDVAMVLDFVPHYGTDKQYIADCTSLTHVWAERCIKHHSHSKQLLFGICQGGTFKDLRENSAKVINSLDFDGVALGGLGIGEGRDLMFNSIKCSTKFIDKNKPRYLMGIGSPEDLLECISLGIDCFDSRFPTMNSRHGSIFTSNGKINIEKSQFKNDSSPIDENCKCPVCKKFSRAFIHHLYKTHEPISERYGSIHNLFFIHNLMSNARKAIKNNEFNYFKKDFLKNYKFNKNKKSSFSYS